MSSQEEEQQEEEQEEEEEQRRALLEPRSLRETRLKTNYGKLLFDLGSCSLHILHSAFQTDVEKSAICLDKLLRALYTLFCDSLSYTEDYTKVTEGAKVPLKFCKTTWLDNSPCALRTIEIWDIICWYVEMVNKKKITNPVNQSFATIHEFVKSPLARPKLVLSVCQQITPF